MSVESIEYQVKLDLLESIREIEKFLREQLGELHVKNGSIERDPFNLARIDSLLRIINSQVVDKGFSPAIKTMLAGLFELENDVKRQMGDKFEKALDYSQENERAIEMLLNDAQADLFKIANLEAETLSGYIRKAVLGNGKLSDLTTQISKDLDIKLNQAMTLVTTSLFSFKQMVTLDLAKQLGIEMFALIGPHDKVTRSWCEHWLNRRGTIADFEATADEWDRESQPNPVKYWRGGYNCRHELIPITPDEYSRFPEGPRE